MTVGKVCGVAISGGGNITNVMRVTEGKDDSCVIGITTVGSGGTWQGITFIGLGCYTDNTKRCGVFRFRNCNIPSGATIVSAYLKPYSWDNRADDTIRLKIWANDTATPTPPTNVATFWALSLTTASVDWDFTTDWVTHSQYTSPDIKTLIQELVDSYGALDKIQIVVWDDGSDTSARRAAADYDNGEDYACVLEITYTV